MTINASKNIMKLTTIVMVAFIAEKEGWEYYGNIRDIVNKMKEILNKILTNTINL